MDNRSAVRSPRCQLSQIYASTDQVITIIATRLWGGKLEIVNPVSQPCNFVTAMRDGQFSNFFAQ